MKDKNKWLLTSNTHKGIKHIKPCPRLMGKNQYVIFKNGDQISGIYDYNGLGYKLEDLSKCVSCVKEINCCIEKLVIFLEGGDEIFLNVNLDSYSGLFVRANVYQSSNNTSYWEMAEASNSIDIQDLVVEEFQTGHTICVEYSRDQNDINGSCCIEVVTFRVENNTTYNLFELTTCSSNNFENILEIIGNTSISPEGILIVGNDEEDKAFYITNACENCVNHLFVLDRADPPIGLRMLFRGIGDTPVADPTSVSDWNTFFDLPNNGLVFTSVLVTGSQVTLFGGGSMIIEDSLFASNTNLIEIEDHAGVVIEGGTNSFIECTNLTRLVFPEMLVAGELCFGSLSSVSFYDLSKLTIAGSLCFENWTIQSLALYSLITAGDRCFGTSTCTQYLMPVATTIGEQAFSGCLSAAYIEIPLCVNLGTTPTDATVFTAIVGQTISLYIAAVNATNNAGAEHASIVDLIAMNSATINYI